MMMKRYQVTMYCTTGEYRPISCIIKRDEEEIDRLGKQGFKEKLKRDGVQKICALRCWDKADLVRYHYTRVKIREYDKIEEEGRVNK